MSGPNLAKIGRRERKRLQQLDHLADIAWELFEAAVFDAVTMGRIAAVANVEEGMRYKLFPVNEVLLRHSFDAELREGEAGAPRLRGFLPTFADWSARNRRYFEPCPQICLSDPGRTKGTGERSGWEQVFARPIVEGHAAGCFRSNVAAQMLAVYRAFLCFAATVRWLTGVARGRVRLLRHPAEGDRLRSGEILVAPSTDPGWTPLFLKAAGLVVETGGVMSHGAIVAREFALPAVVNLPGILSMLHDGDEIEVDGLRGEVRRLAP